MTSTQQLALPGEKIRLEEINMPEELAASLAGQTVAAEVFPEVPPIALRRHRNDPPDGPPILIVEGSVEWWDPCLCGSSTRTQAVESGECLAIGSRAASRPSSKPAATQSPRSQAGSKAG